MKGHSAERTARRRPGLWRPLALVVTVAALLALARLFDLGAQLSSFHDWIHQLGPRGPLVFVPVYAAAVVFALPGLPFTLLAGALFGSIVGIVVVSIAATLGAGLAFLISRYFARDAVVHWLGEKETFRRLDNMTEKHGATIVALTRLVPIFPFNLLNYGFGLTRVPFWTYLFWSWLCMLPATVFYVAGGDVITRALTEGSLPLPLLLTLILALGVLIILARFARRRLQRGKEDS